MSRSLRRHGVYIVRADYAYKAMERAHETDGRIKAALCGWSMSWRRVMRRAFSGVGVARPRSSTTCVLGPHSASERKSLRLLCKPHVVTPVLADGKGPGGPRPVKGGFAVADAMAGLAGHP